MAVKSGLSNLEDKGREEHDEADDWEREGKGGGGGWGVYVIER